MSAENERIVSNDEINLYQYFKIIAKRKKIIIYFFLACVIGAIAYNTISSKIFRAEYIVKMETSHFLDEVRSINEFDKNHIKTVLPQTHEHCNKINISTVLPDTVHYKDAPVYKIKATIDAEDTSSFDNIANELFNYINNSNFYKKSLEEKKDRLEKEIEAISSAINTIKTVIEKAELSEVNENTITEITNSSERLISFKNIKLLLKQSLNNFNGTEVIGKMVYSEPIAPKSKSNISLAAFIGLLAGVFSAFFIEAASKVKNSNG